MNVRASRSPRSKRARVIAPPRSVRCPATEARSARLAAGSTQITSARTPGLPLDVRLPTGFTLSAQVTDVQPEVDAAAQLVFARARIDRSGPAGSVELIPGTQVQVRLASAAKKEP